MRQRFLTWCLLLLGLLWAVAILGCASHQPHYASSPLVSSGVEQPHLPKVVVVVDDALFAELYYFVDDIKDAARKRRVDPRYLGQHVQLVLPPVVTGKENIERFLALVDKSLQSGRVIAELEPGPDWRDHAAVQGTGGFAAGVSISVVPGGSIGAAIAEQTGVLPPTSKTFRVGKDLGLFVGGVGQIVVGCGGLGLGAGATTTGGGAPMGVAIAGASLDVMANGYAAVCVASNDLLHITFHLGDDTVAASGGSGSQPETTTTPQPEQAAPAAKPAIPAANPPRAKPAQTSTAPSARRGGTVKVSPSGTTTRTWVKCTGQQHHAISKTIYEALENHPLLRGKYKYRDDRFVTQAIDNQAHRGYQSWHRDLDNEVVAWIRRYQDKGPNEFEAWLRARYAQSDLKAIFPNGF